MQGREVCIWMHIWFPNPLLSTTSGNTADQGEADEPSLPLPTEGRAGYKSSCFNCSIFHNLAEKGRVGDNQGPGTKIEITRGS